MSDHPNVVSGFTKHLEDKLGYVPEDTEHRTYGLFIEDRGELMSFGCDSIKALKKEYREQKALLKQIPSAVRPKIGCGVWDEVENCYTEMGHTKWYKPNSQIDFTLTESRETKLAKKIRSVFSKYPEDKEKQKIGFYKVFREDLDEIAAFNKTNTDDMIKRVYNGDTFESLAERFYYSYTKPIAQLISEGGLPPDRHVSLFLADVFKCSMTVLEYDAFCKERYQIEQRGKQPTDSSTNEEFEQLFEGVELGYFECVEHDIFVWYVGYKEQTERFIFMGLEEILNQDLFVEQCEKHFNFKPRKWYQPSWMIHIKTCVDFTLERYEELKSKGIEDVEPPFERPKVGPLLLPPPIE